MVNQISLLWFNCNLIVCLRCEHVFPLDMDLKRKGIMEQSHTLLEVTHIEK